ncbi:uncharacterized protein LOC144181106 isoform X3 [Stigmatopora nigra]
MDRHALCMAKLRQHHKVCQELYETLQSYLSAARHAHGPKKPEEKDLSHIKTEAEAIKSYLSAIRHAPGPKMPEKEDLSHIKTEAEDIKVTEEGSVQVKEEQEEHLIQVEEQHPFTTFNNILGVGEEKADIIKLTDVRRCLDAGPQHPDSPDGPREVTRELTSEAQPLDSVRVNASSNASFSVKMVENESSFGHSGMLNIHQRNNAIAVDESNEGNPTTVNMLEEQLTTETRKTGDACPNDATPTRPPFSNTLPTRPPFSNTSMVQFAINGTKDGQMTLADIYEWLQYHFHFFKDGNKRKRKDFIHLILSRSKMFLRKKMPNGNGSYWAIRPESNRGLTLDNVYTPGCKPVPSQFVPHHLPLNAAVCRPSSSPVLKQSNVGALVCQDARKCLDAEPQQLDCPREVIREITGEAQPLDSVPVNDFNASFSVKMVENESSFGHSGMLNVQERNDALPPAIAVDESKEENPTAVNMLEEQLTTETQKTGDARPNDATPRRLPFSKASMVQFAINSTKDGLKTLKEIYEWLQCHFHFFRDGKKRRQKKSIYRRVFKRKMLLRKKMPNGKGSYWAIRPEANRGLTLDNVYTPGCKPVPSQFVPHQLPLNAQPVGTSSTRKTKRKRKRSTKGAPSQGQALKAKLPKMEGIPRRPSWSNKNL